MYNYAKIDPQSAAKVNAICQIWNKCMCFPLAINGTWHQSYGVLLRFYQQLFMINVPLMNVSLHWSATSMQMTMTSLRFQVSSFNWHFQTIVSFMEVTARRRRGFDPVERASGRSFKLSRSQDRYQDEFIAFMSQMEQWVSSHLWHGITCHHRDQQMLQHTFHSCNSQ